jgi:hypothetical protein
MDDRRSSLSPALRARWKDVMGHGNAPALC